MDNKTLVMNPPTTAKPPVTFGIQSDTAFTDTAKGLAGRDLISIADLSVAEMAAIMELSHAVKSAPEDFRHALDAKQMVLIFEKESLRTRLTFETGMNTVGGNALFIDQTKSPLGERESIPDIARNLERWMQIIVLRTYAHETILEMAAASRVPVINALSDLEHPCQAIADFMTLEERFGSLEGLKFTYVGDGNNVCHSLMLAGALLGVHVTVATPKGFAPKLEIVHKAIEIAEETGATITLTTDPAKAATGADAIYTDAVYSMGQEHEAARRAPHLQDLPGQRSPHGQRPGLRRLHALPPRPPRRRSHRRRPRRPPIRSLRPGRKPHARPKNHHPHAPRRSQAHPSNRNRGGLQARTKR